MLILYQGFAKEIAARYNRDPYNMLEKIGKSNFKKFSFLLFAQQYYGIA